MVRPAHPARSLPKETWQPAAGNAIMAVCHRGRDGHMQPCGVRGRQACHGRGARNVSTSQGPLGMHVQTCTCTVHVHACSNLEVHVHVHIHVHVCTCTCMYIHVHTCSNLEVHVHCTEHLHEKSLYKQYKKEERKEKERNKPTSYMHRQHIVHTNNSFTSLEI